MAPRPCRWAVADIRAIGWGAPILLVLLLWYRGWRWEASMAGRHVVRNTRRKTARLCTSWIQRLPHWFFLSLAVIYLCRAHDRPSSSHNGLAHSVSCVIVLLVFSIYIRLRLQESPVFQKIKSEGQTSKRRSRELANWSNLKNLVNSLGKCRSFSIGIDGTWSLIRSLLSIGWACADPGCAEDILVSFVNWVGGWVCPITGFRSN